MTKKDIQVNIYRKYEDFLRVKPLWPLWDPISGNVTISTPAHISLRVSSYHISIVILRK